MPVLAIVSSTQREGSEFRIDRDVALSPFPCPPVNASTYPDANFVDFHHLSERRHPECDHLLVALMFLALLLSAYRDTKDHAYVALVRSVMLFCTLIGSVVVAWGLAPLQTLFGQPSTSSCGFEAHACI